jgi:3-hydroxy-9,10-secoandrosta-1,3,5(10)-triene-9,17-dione monooxygenase reductase component
VIHDTDPFATPEQDRSPVRRLRGRLVAPVTLWTAPGPAGLTVSSVLIADGEPARAVGLVDDESELWAAISVARRFTVCPLTDGQQRLADRFAGLAPAPGGLFAQDEWDQTEYGPVLAGDRTWAGCELESARRCGWGMLVEATLTRILVQTGDEPALAYHRGRYRALHQ